ncbi:fibronectin type III domain-containing protein [Winogradskya humida]|uniref:Fibronectin type-III domain-containing protein n=1 Tax=Winogradskya humida TaxID=113566 RepID=A0ABQ3ZGT6_9ACTN|nr:fibronectin type III domain-containing protein [Actinoplanes humidus]GIE17791.1 hypothetical protein Ahu01nite_008930 [Actinoplanes humidus]
MARLARRFLAGLGGLLLLALLALLAELATDASAATRIYDAVPLSGEPGTLIAASGNIACGHTTTAFNGGKGTAVGCAMGRTSDMILKAGDAVATVLAVGDLQYEHGAWEDLQVSFDPTWGRLRDKIHPVPGSHEYSVSGAPDYYRYWGEQAHPDRKSNYSFEVGGWKIYALSSACSTKACSPGGEMYEWLKGELAGQSPDQCQMAYWHHPIISIGQFGNNPNMPPMARLLYDAGVDVIVNAHDHNYQRWSRITPDSTVDNDNGYRNFIVGTGGINHHRFYAIDPVRHAGFETGTDKEFGVLFMKLNPMGYAWEYRTLGGIYTDSGKETCHREPGTARVPVPASAPRPTPKGQPIPGNKSTLPYPPVVSPSGSGATLTTAWLPPTKPGTSGPVDQYRITVYGSEPGHPTEVVPIAQRTIDGTATSIDYDMSGNPGWSHRVTVEAHNPGGWGNPAVLSSAVDAPGAAAASDGTVPAGWTALASDYPLPPISHPGSPRGVKVETGNAAATVTWRAPTTDGGSPMTGYDVYANPGGLVASVGAAATTASVSDLVNGDSYTFQVVAINDVAESGPTNESAAVVPSKAAQAPVVTVTVPGVPLQVNAQPGNDAATVTWTAPTSDGGSPITSYSIASEPESHLATVDGALRSGRVDGLKAGTSYTFTVTAKNSAGSSMASAASGAIAIAASPSVPGKTTTTTVPGNPRLPIALAGSRSADVTWAAPSTDGGSPLTGYIVTMQPSGLTQTIPAGTRKATFSELTAGTSYRFTVFALNRIGRSAQSDETRPVIPRDPITAPSPPRFVIAAAGDGYAKVAWTAPVSDGGSPVLGYSIVGPSPDIAAHTLATDRLEATVTGLHNGTKYTFTVFAENRAGLSDKSAPTGVVTPQLGLAEPAMPVSVDPTKAGAEEGEDEEDEGSVSDLFEDAFLEPDEDPVQTAQVWGVLLLIIGGGVAFWRHRRKKAGRKPD